MEDVRSSLAEGTLDAADSLVRGEGQLVIGLITLLVQLTECVLQQRQCSWVARGILQDLLVERTTSLG